jgi:hypothetical protein
MLETYDRDVSAVEKEWSTGEVAEKLKTVRPVARGFAARRWGIRF